MKPYENDSVNQIYDLLFCDNLELYRSNSAASEYPWTVVLDNNADDGDLRSVIEDGNVEARVKLLASRVLLTRGRPLADKRIYGVIAEVAMNEGLDVLAAYEDRTARYLNYSGKVIVWETKTPESNELINDLFLAARKVVDEIGPWDKDRLPAPKAGNARISFLVSDGLYFGEAPFEMLAGDPLGGQVIDRAGRLMSFLISSATDQSR
jgi:hypothetical protein